MSSFPEKCAYIVTGHSKGLGREVTKALLLRGDTVFGFSRNRMVQVDLIANLNLLNEHKWDFSQNEFKENLDQIKTDLKQFTNLVFILNAAKNASKTDNARNFLEDIVELTQINFINQIRFLHHLIKHINFQSVNCICVGSYSSFIPDNQSSAGYILSKTLLGDLSAQANFSKVKNLTFKIIYFAGISTTMYDIKEVSTGIKRNIPSRILSTLLKQSPEKAAAKVLRAIDSKKLAFFSPNYLALPIVFFGGLRKFYVVVLKFLI